MRVAYFSQTQSLCPLTKIAENDSDLDDCLICLEKLKFVAFVHRGIIVEFSVKDVGFRFYIEGFRRGLLLFSCRKVVCR